MSNQPKTHNNRVFYQNGYLEDGESERYRQKQSTRYNRVLLISIALAAFAALSIGILFFLTQLHQPSPRIEPARNVVPVPVPNHNSSQPQRSKTETTTIERTIDRTKQVVPAPQQQAPAPKINTNLPKSAPDVNNNVPSYSQKQFPNTQAPATAPENEDVD